MSLSHTTNTENGINQTMSRAPLQTFGLHTPRQAVIARAVDYSNGAHESAHRHLRLQLVYAMSGMLRALTPAGVWMLTPGQALLIGSNVDHELFMVGEVSLRTLYIDPQALSMSEPECRLLVVDDLLRAAMLGLFDPTLGGASDAEADIDDSIHHRLLVPLILRLLQRQHADRTGPAMPPMRLRLPSHSRLRQVCENLIAEPGNQDTLERWAEKLDTSARTLARAFRDEIGLSFGQWREQLRLAEAVSRLIIGHGGADIAASLGYADARSFSVMFRRAMGCTPEQFRQR